jgi:hypothetical protein
MNGQSGFLALLFMASSFGLLLTWDGSHWSSKAKHPGHCGRIGVIKSILKQPRWASEVLSHQGWIPNYAIEYLNG